jgi:hypothetical protein
MKDEDFGDDFELDDEESNNGDEIEEDGCWKWCVCLWWRRGRRKTKEKEKVINFARENHL